MSYLDDPDYRQIRLEFLSEVREFHQKHDHTLDWIVLSEALGVRVSVASTNQHTVLKGCPTITYDASVSPSRQHFTGFHELAHELFSNSEKCYRALLEDKYDGTTAYKMEEKLCDEAAGILLIPDHVLHQALFEYGYCPRAVLSLSGRAGSLSACLMRIVLAHDIDAWGLILCRDGLVEFSCANTRYPLGKSHRIEHDHELMNAWSGYVERRVPLPYRSGKRNVQKMMRAVSNERRVVALFTASFPARVDDRQGSLF